LFVLSIISCSVMYSSKEIILGPDKRDKCVNEVIFCQPQKRYKYVHEIFSAKAQKQFLSY